ncbi:hypothetical protein PFMG_04713 [Plasmodium falciparum IGH-CR14]|uniref:Uncharacterized protein n=1 Tax=Plasmodium falciparum IGH-CR14 TaxID=580059 RepID=A0A0L1IFX8_PLAFA|nr:hypothetical protein PFMG_04713 [Plasmodium falciparum IGH-CR14]
MNNDIKNELINNLPFKFSDISLNSFEKKKEKDKDYIPDEDGGHTWGDFSRDKIGNVKKKEKQKKKKDNEDYNSDDNNDNNNNYSSDHNNNNNNSSSDHNNNKRLVLLKEKLKYNHYYYAGKLAEKEWEENYDNLKKKSQLFKDVLEKDKGKNFSTFNITKNEKICNIKEKAQKKKQNKNQKNLKKKNFKKEHNDISFNDTYTKYSSSLNDFNDISDSLNLKNDIINNEEEYNLTNSLFQSFPMEQNLPLFKYKKENKQDYDNNVKCREYDEKKVPKGIIHEIIEGEEEEGENKKKKKKKKKKNTLDIVHNVINKKISYDDNVNIPYFEDDDNKTNILGENMSNIFEEDKDLDLFSSFKDIFNNHKKKIKLIDYNKILNKSLYDNVENVDSLIAQEKRKKGKKEERKPQKKKKKKRNNDQNSAHNEENMKQIKNNDNFNNMQSLNEYNEKVRGNFFEKKKTENDVKEIIKNIKMRLGFYSNEESDSHDIKCLENDDDNDDDDNNDDNDDNNDDNDDNNDDNDDNNDDDDNNNDGDDDNNNNNDDDNNKNDIYNNLIINEEEEKQNLENLKDNINIPYTSKELYTYKEYSKKLDCNDLNKLSDEKETTKNISNDLELIKKEKKKKNDDTFFFISHNEKDKNYLFPYDHKGDDNYNDEDKNYLFTYDHICDDNNNDDDKNNLFPYDHICDDNYNDEDKNNLLPCDHICDDNYNDEDLFSLSMSSITFDKRKGIKNMECKKSIECVDDKNKLSINYDENNNKNILSYNINVQDENDKLYKNEQKIKQDIYNDNENDKLYKNDQKIKQDIYNDNENDKLYKNDQKIKQDIYNDNENDMLINSMSPENTKYIKNIKENDKLLKNVMKKEEIDKKEKSNICICKYIDKYDMKNLIDEIKKKKKKNDVENSNNSYSEDDVCFYELYKFICSNNIEGNNENIFDDTNINVENVSSNIDNYMQSIFNNQIKYLDNLISQIFS